MYKLICQKPAHSLYAQMALASTFFPLFIVLGMFNFDPSIHSDIFFCDTTYNLIMNNPPLYLTALFCEFWLPVMWHIYSSETPTIRYFTNLITDFIEKLRSPLFLRHKNQKLKIRSSFCHQNYNFMVKLFSYFSCMFLNPNIFFQLNSNCFNLPIRSEKFLWKS